MADLHNESQREIEKMLYKLCKNTGAVILQTQVMKVTLKMIYLIQYWILPFLCKIVNIQ
jgi:hypothetical protein